MEDFNIELIKSVEENLNTTLTRTYVTPEYRHSFVNNSFLRSHLPNQQTETKSIYDQNSLLFVDVSKVIEEEAEKIKSECLDLFDFLE
jgi:hypothetical protein